MPLFEDISALITQFRRQKIPEWKDDTFPDLTDPCEQDDVNTFLQNLIEREKIVKDKKEVITPKLSELIDKYKKMSGKLKNPAGRDTGERGISKQDLKQDFTAVGKSAPTGTKRAPQHQGKLSEAERYKLLSKSLGILKSALDTKITQTIDFHWPDTQTDDLKRDIETLEQIRIDAQSRKAICEWMSSGIEKLKVSIKEDIDHDFKKDKPAGVNKSAENLESIQREINEYKTKLQKHDDSQEMFSGWLDHIQQILKPAAIKPPDFQFNESQDKKRINKMNKIASGIWNCVSSIKDFESEQTEVKEELDKYCKKIGVVTDTQAANTKTMKSDTGVKATLALLTKMTESLIDRVKKAEKELEIEKSKIKKLTEEKGTKLRNEGTTEERLKATETELKQERSKIKELTEAKDEMSKDLATTKDRLKKEEAELERERSNTRKITDEKDELLKNIATKTESEKILADLEKQVQDYKDALRTLHCISKDEKIDESTNGKTDTQKSRRNKPEYNCGVQETVQLVQGKISKLKEEYQALTEKVSSCYFEIEKIGLANMDEIRTTAGRQRPQNALLLLSDSIKKAQDRVADIKQSLAKEESLQKQQAQRCRENFKIIREACQQNLRTGKFRSEKRTGDSEQKVESDTESVEKSGSDAVELFMEFLDRYNDDKVKAKEAYENEVIQLTKEKQETEKNNAELRYRLSKHMGAELMTDNPNIADLSDSNRPTKLAEIFSELYDNDWTNAYEDLHRKDMTGIDIVKSLLDILKFAFEYCRDTADMQLKGLLVHVCTPAALQIDPPGKEVNPKEIDTVSKQALNELRKKTFAVASANLTKLSIDMMKGESRWKDVYASKSCQKYIKSCINICWLMSIQSPPVHLDFDIDKKGKFDDKKYKAYSKRGKEIDYMIWPPIYISKGGNLLAKGVAEGK